MTSNSKTPKTVQQVPEWFTEITMPDNNSQFVDGQIGRALSEIAVNYLELKDAITHVTAAAAILAGVALPHDAPLPSMSMDNLSIGHGIISVLSEHNSDLIQATQLLRAANHYLRALVIIADEADPCPF